MKLNQWELTGIILNFVLKVTVSNVSRNTDYSGIFKFTSRTYRLVIRTRPQLRYFIFLNSFSLFLLTILPLKSVYSGPLTSESFSNFHDKLLLILFHILDICALRIAFSTVFTWRTRERLFYFLIDNSSTLLFFALSLLISFIFC